MLNLDSNVVNTYNEHNNALIKGLNHEAVYKHLAVNGNGNWARNKLKENREKYMIRDSQLLLNTWQKFQNITDARCYRNQFRINIIN